MIASDAFLTSLSCFHVCSGCEKIPEKNSNTAEWVTGSRTISVNWVNWSTAQPFDLNLKCRLSFHSTAKVKQSGWKLSSATSYQIFAVANLYFPLFTRLSFKGSFAFFWNCYWLANSDSSSKISDTCLGTVALTWHILLLAATCVMCYSWADTIIAGYLLNAKPKL